LKEKFKGYLSMARVRISLFVCLLALWTTAYAQSPREQLNSMVQQLQKTPDDAALREKIIKLALEMKPAPATPPEVYELAGRAAYAIKHATSEADFVAAAEAYGKASLLAPWLADYYFNRGVAYDKANRFDDAIAAFNWYLLAAPNAQDANEVRERIGGLKYAKEKSGRQEAERAEAARKAAERELERKRTDFSGDWIADGGQWSFSISKDSSGSYTVIKFIYRRGNAESSLTNIRVNGNTLIGDEVQFNPLSRRVDTMPFELTLAPDGESLQVRLLFLNPKSASYTVRRRK
jgi:tetratricopeptide (TPR) repeat protein